MYLIDTHAHIYLPEFDTDRQDCIARAKEAGITEIIMPAIDSSTHDIMLQVEEKYPACIAMMGLHPCSVNKEYKKELETVEGYLQKRKFVAVGEIGLDFYWDKTFTSQQFEAFHFQIELALKYRIPIVIHTRNAMPETIDVVRQYTGKNLRGIFHCFSGTYQQAIEI